MYLGLHIHTSFPFIFTDEHAIWAKQFVCTFLLFKLQPYFPRNPKKKRKKHLLSIHFYTQTGYLGKSSFFNLPTFLPFKIAIILPPWTLASTVTLTLATPTNTVNVMLAAFRGIPKLWTVTILHPEPKKSGPQPLLLVSLAVSLRLLLSNTMQTCYHDVHCSKKSTRLGHRTRSTINIDWTLPSRTWLKLYANRHSNSLHVCHECAALCATYQCRSRQ